MLRPLGHKEGWRPNLQPEHPQAAAHLIMHTVHGGDFSPCFCNRTIDSKTALPSQHSDPERGGRMNPGLARISPETNARQGD
jgi:hypothetical protein